MPVHHAFVDDKMFNIKKSTRKNKKYDVFDENMKYVLSFGDTRYQHYYDKLHEYHYLNHHDEYRRKNYRTRSEGIGHLGDPYSSNYWSYHLLW
jgi:hypothetical protein